MAKKTKENDEKIVKKTASKTATKKVAAKKEPKKVLNKTNKKAPSTKKTIAKKGDILLSIEASESTRWSIA